MSNRAASSFGATDQRVYVTNNRVPVFDFNTEQIKLDLSSGNVKVGITGPFIYGGFLGVTGNFGGGSVGGKVEISGNVTLAPNTTVGLTGPYIYGGFLGVTGAFQSGPMTISGGITGTVAVNNFPSSFGVTGPVNINGVTGVNGKLPVYDASAIFAINNQSLKAMIDDGTGAYVLTEVQGNINTIGLNSLSVYNYDLDVKLTSDPGVTAAIQTTVKNTVDVSGAVSLRSGITGQVSITGPVSLNPNTLVGLTGSYVYGGYIGVTGAFQSGPMTISGGITGQVSITGTAQVNDTSANITLSNIYNGLTGGILALGQDDTGARYPLYATSTGVQRTQIVPAHSESAKYIFETDLASLIPTGTLADWSLDVRGRLGWYFNGPTVTSLLNWYSNAISSPPVLDFNKAQAVYMIMTPDITTTMPRIRIQTIVGITPTSVWEYTITGTVYNGETYLFYYGNKAIALHPEYHPSLMTRTLISGPGAGTEHIYNIQVYSTSGSRFLLDRTGIYDQTNAQQFETIYSTNKDLAARNNLASLSFSGSSLSVAGNVGITGGVSLTGPVSLASGTVVGITGGVTGSVSVNNFPASFGVTGLVGLTGPVRVADGSGNFITSKELALGTTRGLDTTSYMFAYNNSSSGYTVLNSRNIVTSTVNSTFLDVNPVQVMRPVGARGNVLSNVTLTAWSNSSVVSILDASTSKQYGSKSFVSYEDTSPASTGTLILWGVDSGGGYHAINPAATPVVINATGTGVPFGRYWSSTVDLSPFVSLVIKNEGSTSLTGVYLSVLTGASCTF